MSGYNNGFIITFIYQKTFGKQWRSIISRLTLNQEYQTSKQNSFLGSSVSFPPTCFPRLKFADRSIIRQLLSSLMELSTNKSKILCT